jgi:hypothetical protein
LNGRVNPEATHSGPPPTLSQEEEAHLTDHLKLMASCGYGYSRAEVVDMASEYAIFLGKRDKEHPFTLKWFRLFMKRWPELKVLKPRGLEIQRAKATNKESVSVYYTELGNIMDKYDLKHKPERIYNVDEKGLSTSHKPPSVVASCESQPQAVTSGSRTLITVIGCGNAMGNSVPPFFVFPGLRMKSELLDGGGHGVDGTVTESGWSNSAVFKRYLEQHLLKYLPERCLDNPVLILYDGHKSHINLGLIDWAKSQNIILFVLPAHTSHVLQPLDVGCFGPFERIYSSVCHKFMRDNCGQSITRFNVCALGSKAYSQALSPNNLQASFRRTGIYPYDPNAIDSSVFKPSEALQQETSSLQSIIQPSETEVSQFFCNKEANIISKKQATKKRKYLSSVVSGKPITEDVIIQKIQDHEEGRNKKTKTQKLTVQPGPSGTVKAVSPVPALPADESSGDEDETEVCCVCSLFTPSAVRQSSSLVFVKWVQCSACGHWVHLIYCTKLRVVRRGDIFMCPHCVGEE